MLGRADFTPVFLAQPFELQDREGLLRLQSLTQEMSDLLRDRAMLAFRPSLKFFVECVRQVFDIQNCHQLLHNSSMVEDE